MDIITSKRVARKVVQDLKLAEGPSTRATVRESGGRLWIDRGLAGRSGAESVDLRWKPRKASISSRSPFHPPTPAKSAGIANAFAKAYTLRHVSAIDRACPASRENRSFRQRGVLQMAQLAARLGR